MEHGKDEGEHYESHKYYIQFVKAREHAAIAFQPVLLSFTCC